MYDRIQSVSLDRVRYCYEQSLSGLVDARDISVEADHGSRSIRARIEMQFWGKRLPQREKEFSAPRTWLDHFLLAFARHWLVAFLTRKGWVRRPQIVVTKVTFEETAIWPELKVDPFNGERLMVRVCDMRDDSFTRYMTEDSE
jgi:hypothetical protein